MSAGDPRIRGSVGTGGKLYNESSRSPVVTYEAPTKAQYGITVNKLITRTLVCLKKDVPTVLSTLAVTDATISGVCAGVDASGAAQTLDFGGGWSLKRVGTPPRDSTTCEINLTYEKTVTSAFEFGLPTNLSLVQTGGVSTFKYKTTSLKAVNSRKGSTTSGLQVSLRDAYYAGIPQNNGYLLFWVKDGAIYQGGEPPPGAVQYLFPSIPGYRLSLNVVMDILCDGILVESVHLSESDYGAPQIAANYSSVGVVPYDPDNIPTPFYEEFVPYVSGINQTLRWDTSVSNHIRLILWDKVVWDWDVEGL